MHCIYSSQLLTESERASDEGPGGIALSTDDFFRQAGGAYFFDRSKLDEAHTWNRQRGLLVVFSSLYPQFDLVFIVDLVK